MLLQFALGYAVLISLIAVIVTVSDKKRSRYSGARRVPENTLILIAMLGGSAAMLAAMLTVRHKTRHVKFMAGLPIILLFQGILVLYILWRIAG